VIEAVYVYGVLPSDADVSSGTDAASLGGTVTTVQAGPLAALVEEIDDDRALGTRADLIAHSTVVDAAAGRATLVPLRFGTVLPSLDAVSSELLTARREELLEMIEVLRDRVQYRLRARFELDEVLREIVLADPEIARLRERVGALPEDAAYFDRVRLGELVSGAVAGRRDNEAPDLLEALRPLAVEHTVREPGGMDHLLDAAFLVRTDQQEDFELAAEHQAERLAGRARLRLVGPTAAYDFVAGV
jgi:hypothetical protein